MSSKKIALGCALAVVALGAIVGRVAPLSAAESSTKSFTMRVPGDPETMDWNRAHTAIETPVVMNIMEGLLSLDASLRVRPALAQSWTVSPDGRTYTFKLRAGVKWSDGVLLKAADFVYSWRRLLSQATAASYAYFLFDVEGAEWYNKGTLKDFDSVGIKAVDDQTFQVKLTHPVAHWIYVPTFWVTFPMREDLVTKLGPSWTEPGKLVTLGPYLLASHEADSKIVLKANPTYYGVRGNVDEVDVLVIKDDSTALSLYEAGKLDFLTEIASFDLKRLAGRPDLKSFPYLKTAYLGFVVTKHPTNNKAFRRAVSMAIDRSKLGEVLHGGQEGATSFVPPRMLGYSQRLGLGFDPVKAKAELKSSGIDLDRPVSAEMILPNWDKELSLARFVQTELKRNLGINIVLQPFDNKTFHAQQELKSYPLFSSRWVADYPDPDNFMSVFLSTSGNNRTGWKSDKYDELVLSARELQDSKAREKIYTDAQRMLIEDEAVIAPLYYEPVMALVKPRIHDLELNPVDQLLLRKVTLAP